jgi:hypothetical protein
MSNWDLQPGEYLSRDARRTNGSVEAANWTVISTRAGHTLAQYSVAGVRRI